jgi:GAF domain-containing protein
VEASRQGAVALEYVEALRQIEAAEETYAVEQALTAARERLSMDAAYVSTVDSERQTIDAVVGDVGALGLEPGFSLPIEETYCGRMLGGQLPNVVPDTSLEPAIRDLPVTGEIGSYIGVPVTLSDGRVHGTLCCASHDPHAELGGKELGFMKVLADIVAIRVEHAQGDLSGREERLRESRPGD